MPKNMSPKPGSHWLKLVGSKLTSKTQCALIKYIITTSIPAMIGKYKESISAGNQPE